MRNLTLFLLGTSLLVSPACGGDPVEATTTDSSTGGASTGTTDPTTNPTTASTTGVGETTTGGSGTSEASPTTTGEPETTSTSTTSEPGTTTTEGTTSGTTEPVDTTTTDGTTTGGTTTTDGTTGEPVVCDGLPAMACMADDACMPLGGGKLNLQKMCVSKPMFLGCVDAGACGGALTYACESAVEPPEPYLFPSTCLPEGWEPCEAPPIEMPCK